MNEKILKKERRRKRIRPKVLGSASRPRLSVFRSNRYIYAQLVDDEKRHTLLSASEEKLKEGQKLTKIERAKLVGELLAQKAEKLKIKRVVFDRAGYKYHGRIKSLAQGAKEKGLIF